MTLKSKMSNSKHKVSLPGSIRNFVERQARVPLESLFEDSETPFYPYCEYWRRAVAAMLLSGRIAAKDDTFPNMTDVKQIGRAHVELQSPCNLVCRLLLVKKKNILI